MKVRARTGIYQGHRAENQVVEFLGIPYCKPLKRWKAAQPLEASDQQVDGERFGPVCWQHVTKEEWETVPAMSEDCLTLNIWTADLDRKKKPVMVWIHGGSYYTGGSCIACCNGVYCGDKLVEANPDIIFVNFNYRLNVFGMLDLSFVDESGEYADSLNLSTLDQIAALKWIWENIRAFGGDPDNITVFGQSAGGGSVAALCCLPDANRYFQKAIIQSAGISDQTLRKKEDAAKVGRAILDHLGASTMEELLRLSPEELVKAAEWYFEECGGDNTVPFEPTWGAGILPDRPLEVLRNGAASHLTVMTGSTSGEYASWVASLDEEEILRLIEECVPQEVSRTLIEQYIQSDPARSRREALIDFHMDVLLRAAQICTAEALVQGGSDVYNYYISCIPPGAAYKPQHCFEIPYIMGKPMNYIYLDLQSGEPCQGKNPLMELVGLLQGCWCQFARTGNPNGRHMAACWEPYTLQGHETLVIDETLSMVNGVREADMALIMPMHRGTKAPINIMAVGDLVLDRPGPMDQYFKAAAGALSAADLLIGQVETPHTNRPVPSSIDYQAPPSDPDNLDVLADYNFKVLTLAGNHIYDCGTNGVIDTYGRIWDKNMIPTGAGANLNLAKKPAVYPCGGITTGTLSYNAVGPAFSYATSEKAGCNYIRVLTHFELQQATPGGTFPPKVYTFADPDDVQMMKEEIESLKSRCDLVIVSLHKGDYNDDGHLEMYERPLAQAAVDAGADLVISHHAHQTRGIEIYKGKPIYHGLGNFVCVTYALTPGYSNSTENDRFAELEEDFEMPEVLHYPWEDNSRFSLIAKVIANEYGIVEAGYIPCYIEKDTTAPTPRTRESGGQEVFDHIRQMSDDSNLKTKFFWSEDGSWILCKA